MRLITFDMLICVSKNCHAKEIPLELKVEESTIIPQEVNRELIEKMLEQLKWESFVKVCQENNMLIDFSD